MAVWIDSLNRQELGNHRVDCDEILTPNTQ